MGEVDLFRGGDGSLRGGEARIGDLDLRRGEESRTGDLYGKKVGLSSNFLKKVILGSWSFSAFPSSPGVMRSSQFWSIHLIIEFKSLSVAR